MSKKTSLYAMLASAALHLSIFAVAPYSVNTENIKTAKKNEIVCPNNSLECLIDKRKQFDGLLFEDLKDGSLDSMALHEMSISRDVLAHNIETAENGFADFLDAQQLIGSFEDYWKENSHQVQLKPTTEEKMDVIQQLMFEHFFIGYLGKEARTSTILTHGKFNCDSSAEFHMMSAEFLGVNDLPWFKQWMLIYDDHITSLVVGDDGKRWKYEHTAGDGFRSDYAKAKKGLIAPIDFQAVMYLVGQGYPIEEFPSWAQEIYQEKLGNENFSRDGGGSKEGTNTTKRYPKPGVQSGSSFPDLNMFIPTPAIRGGAVSERSGLSDGNFFSFGRISSSGRETARGEKGSYLLQREKDLAGEKAKTDFIYDEKKEFYLEEAKKGLIYPEAADIDWLKEANGLLGGYDIPGGFTKLFSIFSINSEYMKNRFCHYLILDQEFSKGKDIEQRHKPVMDRYRKIVDSAVEELRRSSDDEAKFGPVAILSDLGLLCMPEVVRKKIKQKSNPANEFYVDISLELPKQPELSIRRSIPKITNPLNKRIDEVMDPRTFELIFSALERELDNEDAIVFFGNYGDERSMQYLHEVLKKGDDSTLPYLAINDDVEAIKVIMDRMSKLKNDRKFRYGSVLNYSFALGESGYVGAGPVLLTLLGKSFPEANFEIADALDKLGYKEGRDYLSDNLSGGLLSYPFIAEHPELKDKAISLLKEKAKGGLGHLEYANLVELGDDTYLEEVLDLFRNDPHYSLNYRAASALVRNGYFR